MSVTRRDFVKWCSTSAVGLTLSTSELTLLSQALAAPGAPSVLWLEGSGCTGCSVSFLNRISSSSPTSVAEVLISKINLVYHTTLMGATGDLAVSAAKQAYENGGYVLVVEGGVPTAFNGATCVAWHYNGQDVTFLDAVRNLSAKASKILCFGTCACYGGMAAAAPNPTMVKGVKAATGKAVINIPGCPPHPDWMVWAIAQVLLGSRMSLDEYGRPVSLYNTKVHERCPRREAGETSTWGIDGRCLEELGCRGPEAKAPCVTSKWNNGVNWCVDANALCLDCTAPGFPFSTLVKPEDSEDTMEEKRNYADSEVESWLW